jgi:hypothetical protein
MLRLVLASLLAIVTLVPLVATAVAADTFVHGYTRKDGLRAAALSIRTRRQPVEQLVHAGEREPVHGAARHAVAGQLLEPRLGTRHAAELPGHESVQAAAALARSPGR